MDFKKKFAGDFSLTFLGVLIYNGALQFIIYPMLSKTLGNDAYGEILYYIGIFSITSIALGLSTANTRLVQRNNYEISNGDCMSFNFIILAIMSVACAVLLSFQKISALDIVMVIVVQALMAIRTYSEVVYKIAIAFKRYLYFYIVVTVGYILGIVIFKWQK